MKQNELIQENLIRFSLIVAGFVVYLGNPPLLFFSCLSSLAHTYPTTGMHTHAVRQIALTTWMAQSDTVGLQGVSNEIDVQSAVDASQLRQWHRAGLPKDATCIQTAVIASLSARWPLFIDPHGVARKWIKATERSNQLRILLPTQHDFVRALENAVATGRVVYIDHAVGDDGLLPSVLSDLLRPIANYSANFPATVRIMNEVSYNKKFKYEDVYCIWRQQFTIIQVILGNTPRAATLEPATS